MEIKMEINGKKIGLYYSIGADCDIDDEMEKVGCPTWPAFLERLGPVKAYIKVATILNKWYCLKNGGDPVSEKDLFLLPAGQLETIWPDVDKAMAEGRRNEIKAKPVKGKNAESAVE